MQPGSATHRSPRVWVVAALILAAAGCGEPRVAHIRSRNHRLLQALRTAVSAKRADWLEQNAQLIEERHATGEMTDEEFDALNPIVAQARQGMWAQAESDLTRLIKAQRATAEEMEDKKATVNRVQKSGQSEE